MIVPKFQQRLLTIETFKSFPINRSLSVTKSPSYPVLILSNEPVFMFKSRHQFSVRSPATQNMNNLVTVWPTQTFFSTCNQSFTCTFRVFFLSSRVFVVPLIFVRTISVFETKKKHTHLHHCCAGSMFRSAPRTFLCSSVHLCACVAFSCFCWCRKAAIFVRIIFNGTQ